MIQNFQEEACFILDTMKGNEILKHALTLIVRSRVCEMGYHVPWHTDHMTTYRGWFCHSTLWILGTKLRSLDLAASTVTPLNLIVSPK